MQWTKLAAALTILMQVNSYAGPTKELNLNPIMALEKGSLTPYRGYLIPETVFFDYESGLAQRDACFSMVENVPVPVYGIKSDLSTMVKGVLGLGAFVLCATIANGQSFSLGHETGGCLAGAAVLTTVLIFE